MSWTSQSVSHYMGHTQFGTYTLWLKERDMSADCCNKFNVRHIDLTIMPRLHFHASAHRL